MTTPTLRELIEEADAVITALLGYCSDQTSTAKDAIGTLEGIRASLAAQPELPEPVAKVESIFTLENAEASDLINVSLPTGTLLYTAAQLQQAAGQERRRNISADALNKPPHPTPAETGVGEWCAPGPAAQQKRIWMLKFEDAERGYLLYDDEGFARDSFARSEGLGWNCHLFAHVPRVAEQAQAKREPMTREQMRDIFLANGFTVKEGQDDLKDYVYAAGRAIEAHHNIGDKA